MHSRRCLDVIGGSLVKAATWRSRKGCKGGFSGTHGLGTHSCASNCALVCKAATLSSHKRKRKPPCKPGITHSSRLDQRVVEPATSSSSPYSSPTAF